MKLTIPVRFQSCTFETYKPKSKKQADTLCKMSEHPHESYFIHGPYGAGKTHLLYAQYRENYFVYGEKNCFVRSTHELIRELQDEEVKEKPSPINLALKPQDTREILIHLFWDDADKFKVTDYREEALFDLIDRIYKNNEKLTITSNASLSELQEKLSPAICRRIDDICKLVEV